METLDSMFSLFVEALDSIFFILIGTCFAASNLLLGIACLRAAGRSSLGFHDLVRFCLYLVGYELSISLFLSSMTLSAVAMLAAVGMMQFLAYRANGQWTQIAFQTLKTHLPDSQGPKAVGSWLIFMTLLSIFLLLGTSLRDEPLWIRLLFTTLTPFSAFCGVSLLAVVAQRPR